MCIIFFFSPGLSCVIVGWSSSRPKSNTAHIWSQSTSLWSGCLLYCLPHVFTCPLACAWPRLIVALAVHWMPDPGKRSDAIELFKVVDRSAPFCLHVNADACLTDHFRRSQCTRYQTVNRFQYRCAVFQSAESLSTPLRQTKKGGRRNACPLGITVEGTCVFGKAGRRPK